MTAPDRSSRNSTTLDKSAALRSREHQNLENRTTAKPLVQHITALIRSSESAASGNGRMRWGREREGMESRKGRLRLSAEESKGRSRSEGVWGIGDGYGGRESLELWTTVVDLIWRQIEKTLALTLCLHGWWEHIVTSWIPVLYRHSFCPYGTVYVLYSHLQLV
jgi:hypothetical protein